MDGADVFPVEGVDWDGVDIMVDINWDSYRNIMDTLGLRSKHGSL